MLSLLLVGPRRVRARRARTDGASEPVVDNAADATMATGTARVTTTGPYVAGERNGRRSKRAPMISTISGRCKDNPPLGVTQPAAVLDLLRGVVNVRSYGGAEVQGIGTKRYEVDFDLRKAIAATPAARRADLQLLDGKLGDDGELWADVFVDSAGRVRRILLPVQHREDRPYGDDKRIPQLVSVDFFDFGKAAQ